MNKGYEYAMLNAVLKIETGGGLEFVNQYPRKQKKAIKKAIAKIIKEIDNQNQ